MTQDTTQTRVARIIADHFGGLKLADIEPDMKLEEDLGADSLDNVELIMALEEEFAVTITDDAAEACQTVGDIQQLIVTLQGGVA